MSRFGNLIYERVQVQNALKGTQNAPPAAQNVILSYLSNKLADLDKIRLVEGSFEVKKIIEMLFKPVR